MRSSSMKLVLEPFPSAARISITFKSSACTTKGVECSTTACSHHTNMVPQEYTARCGGPAVCTDIHTSSKQQSVQVNTRRLQLLCWHCLSQHKSSCNASEHFN